MLRKLSLSLALLSLLAGMLVTNRAAKAAPPLSMQTIKLNTGFDHGLGFGQKYFVAANVFPLGTTVGPLDEYWTVVKDPINGTTPHAANNINRYFSAWAPAQNDSQWISYSQTGSQGLQQGSYYYQKCFCMTKELWENQDAIQQSSLVVSVRADDAFYLGLNTIPAPQVPLPNTYQLKYGPGGGFNGPPAVWTVSGPQLVKMLRPGRNCLNVRVDDIGGVITGFNLEGSLTTIGVDGIAKTNGPKSPAQFNGCSSCSRMRFDTEVELKGATLRGDLAKPPER
jgi:hypothetical protein